MKRKKKEKAKSSMFVWLNGKREEKKRNHGHDYYLVFIFNNFCLNRQDR